MSNSTIYDERAVVLAYVDAQRPPYPHEDFRRFRRARLEVLEKAYRIRISLEGVSAPNSRILWMLFRGAVDSYLNLEGPRDGFLEDGLINVTIDRLGGTGMELRAIEDKLYMHLSECRTAHLELLTRLFVLLWGPIERPLSSADLRSHSFDDSKEPRLSDYYDEM